MMTVDSIMMTQKLTMNEPRHTCQHFMIRNGCSMPIELTRVAFDELVRNGQFEMGPFMDTFGDGYGEPYNPRRQLYGKLKDGRFVFAERYK